MRTFLISVLFINIVFAQSITDMLDRSVEIKDTKKIVCLGPGALRLIAYLGLQDRLVGIEKLEKKYDLKSPYRAILDKKAIKSLKVVSQGGPGKMPNLETLITLNPDIIFTSFLSKEQVELIQKKTKIPVVALSYGASYGGAKKLGKLEAIKSSLKLIADITGKEKRADELISFMQKEEAELAKLKLSSQKVYIGGIGYKGAQGITSTESAYPSFKLLKLENKILKGKKGHMFINKEAILAYDPQIIFLDFLGKKIVKEELKSDKKIYSKLDAFKNKKVHWLYPYNFYNTNIENVFINSWYIASYLGHSVDLKTKKEQIYKMFLSDKGLKVFLEANPYNF